MDFIQYLREQKLADTTIKIHAAKVNLYKEKYGNVGYEPTIFLNKPHNSRLTRTYEPLKPNTSYQH